MKPEELPADWETQLTDLPDRERGRAREFIQRLECAADQVDAFLLARDFGACVGIVVERDKTIKALRAELKDLQARRVERIATLVRGEGGAIVGAVTERIEGSTR